MARATVFEEHASVLPHWFGLGLQGTTLVSLDAHLDLQFVDAARIARLRACSGADEMAALQSPHPLSPERGCFGIEDFLYPAAQLGIVRRLVWVAPPHVLQAGIEAALAMLQQMEGVTLDQLESFHRTPQGWIEGRLLGLDVAIGELQQLVRLELAGPVAVDIDADYFVVVPDDRVWADPAQVVACLKRWLGAGIDLTIARSVGTGFLPLEHGALADRLAALWEGRTDAAPAPAQLSGADDLIRRLGEFRARCKRLDRAVVLSLQREVAVLRDTPERESTAWTALGLLHTSFGRLQDAMACHTQALRRGPGHPDLALEIAKLQLAAGRLDEAAAFLRCAAADDETRVAAWFELSRCAAASGALDDAWRWACSAQAAAPAWPQLLRWLILLAQQQKDGTAAPRAEAALRELQARLGRLQARLAA
jgi:hypothetical protein